MKKEVLMIRLSEIDKEIIRHAAEQRQMSMSEYIINLVRLDQLKKSVKGDEESW
jgi:uncharacterized protein (DUF1778 family)